MTIEIRDSREGIEVVSIYHEGVTIVLDVPQKIGAYDICRWSHVENTYFTTKENV